jgi:uncharacterized small protein (DUF1192 family)
VARQKSDIEVRAVQEIERLNATLKLKVEEVRDWQEKFNSVLVRLKELEPRATFLAQEYERLQLLHTQANSEKEGLRAKMQELELK